MIERKIINWRFSRKRVATGGARLTAANARGGVLVLTMALIAALSMLAIVSLDFSPDENQSSFDQRNREQAFYIAQAGAREGLVELYRNDRWRAGFPYQEMAGGFFVVRVTDSVVNPELADTLLLQAQALYGQSAVSIDVALTRSKFQPFAYALFSRRALRLSQNFCTDSYNSKSGSYQETRQNSGASVGSNGTVTLGSYAVVGGDVTSSVARGLRLDSGKVTGDAYSGVSPEKFAKRSSLEFSHAKANSRARSGISGTGYTYNSATRDLSLKNGGDVKLRSGVYYFRHIKLQERASISLASGAAVTIYVSGKVVMRDQSSMNRKGAPVDFQLVSRGTAFDMYHESEFRGAFYGPGVTFTARQWIDFYGALVVKRASLYPDVCIHYDRNLAQVLWDGKYGVIAWNES